MSYQVLARKWRPHNFDDMVGQPHVIKALSNALDNNRLHHAYLFTGTRGVGKTTLARIIAKCLNCETGVSSTPCGQCSACISINEGRFVDLIEVDAASRAKVDETRDLMENVQYSPSVGRYKVYLIDEVHMFSNHSFNALLKTLEEPPPHVKFLLATTEAKKIPVTILSRCLQFNLKHLNIQQIESQLLKITKAENFECDQESLNLIAIAADGSLRDALSLLDQAISHGGGKLEKDQVNAMLGSIDNNEIYSLIHHLVSGDAKSLLEDVNRIAENNPDYDILLADILSLLQQIAIHQVLNNESDTQHAKMDELSSRLSPEDLQLYYQFCVIGRRDLAFAPNPRSGFEMTLIRMLAFTSEADGKIHLQNHKSLNENKPANEVKINEDSDLKNSHVPEATDNLLLSVNNWRELIDEMALVGLVKELAGHCVLKEYTSEKIHLVLSPTQEHLLNPVQKQRLQTALKTRFGEKTNIIISVEEPECETPAQNRVREEGEKQLAAEKAIKQDPSVRAMQDIFDATLIENSIKPKTN